ncbi:MAG TPA: 4a-hydroxytetrahydrobiopterin dehydratase [Pyrinomonadaceae bacterium]|nr:4a-hydroxytetrahydrobiopterin dehydratase [Pyrinomonadaceae bacterium]
MNREKLEAEEIAERLAGLEGWNTQGDSLNKRFKFENFAAALAFVNKAGALAEAMDHHPDIQLGWGFAEFDITTHDRGGITDFDFALARQIQDLQ